MHNKEERISHMGFLIVSVAAVVLSALSALGVLDSIPWFMQRSDSIILFLLSALCVYIAIDRQFMRQHDLSIRESIESSKKTLLSSLRGIETNEFSSGDKAFKYVIERLGEVKESVSLIAIAPTPNLNTDILKKYRDACEDILKTERIKFTCVSEQSLAVRWNTYVEYTKKYNKFLLSSVNTNREIIPTLNFFIFDNEEVFMRHPHDERGAEHYIGVNHPGIVSLFLAYHEKILAVSEPYTN